MGSVTKTTNLALPQWSATEKPERTDFNAAFLAIDVMAGTAFQPYYDPADADLITKSGTYGVTDVTAHVPANYGALVHFAAGNYPFQIYMAAVSHVLYHRVYFSGAWKAWKTITSA